jgi:hypothetical protein
MPQSHSPATRKKGGRFLCHPLLLDREPLSLKAEPHAHLACEAVRKSHSDWRNEINRLTECCVSHVAVKVVPEVGPVCQVKNLEDRLKVSPLFDLEVLSDPCVELEEGLSAQVSKGAIEHWPDLKQSRYRDVVVPNALKVANRSLGLLFK